MELLFEFLFEIFFSAVLKPLYYVTIRPLIVMVGYLSFPIIDKENRTLDAKNTLSWDELEDIGWQSLSVFFRHFVSRFDGIYSVLFLKLVC